MQHLRTLLILWAVVLTPQVACVTPLGKVLDLLDCLTAKISEEAQAEAKANAIFVEWCADTMTNTKNQIKTATAKQKKLEAMIIDKAGEISAAGRKIEGLAGSIATDEADLKSATSVRDRELADFVASEAELMDVVDTVSRAIPRTERAMAKNPAAFSQTDTKTISGLVKTLSTVVDAASFSTQDKNKLLGLVQSWHVATEDDDESGAPAATVYKSHNYGDSILDVMDDLKVQAEEQLSNLRQAETSAKHNYEMLKQSLEDQIAADTKDMDETKSVKAAAEEAKAAVEGELAVTVKELANSQADLEKVRADCMQAAADHEAIVKGREEEVNVIEEARNILVEFEKGAVDKTYSFWQRHQHQAVSHLHTRTDLANVEVYTLINNLARKHHSAALAQLASRIDSVMRFGMAAGQDPFAKVKELITDLIAKLQAEATEKAYCDEQMAKTEEKREELQHDVSKLMTKLEQSISKSATLKSEVKELQSELVTLTKEQAEMDEIRKQQHEDYAKAKADLEAGLAAVRKALALLREYYGRGATAAMLQQPVTNGHDKATGAGNSIIGILEVVASQFAKSLAAEETAEEDAICECGRVTQVNSATEALKLGDIKLKAAEANSLDRTIGELSSDHSLADAELDAVLDYVSKIKERCSAKAETYEHRSSRRQAEIEGLKEALAILENETTFMQRGKRAVHSQFLGLH